jgi:heme-degrading monooxygenase HmoA
MLVTLTVITTKPEGTAWFVNSSEENRQIVSTINSWTRSQPGFISQNTVDSDVNTKVMTFQWDSVENYANWFSLRTKLPEQIIRAAYNKANGITHVSNETLS